MADDTKPKNLHFSPAIPIPLPFDAPARIAALKRFLDPENPDYEPEDQHVNIRAAIGMYEDGTLHGQQVCIMDGKIVPKKERYRSKSRSWSEGVYYQLVQKA